MLKSMRGWHWNKTFMKMKKITILTFIRSGYFTELLLRFVHGNPHANLHILLGQECILQVRIL
jgi:hypothetical protein